MFAAIKEFFAPSFAFSWAEIKAMIWQAVAHSYQVFCRYFRIFWFMVPVFLLIGVFFFKDYQLGTPVETDKILATWFEAYPIPVVVFAVLFVLWVPVAYMSSYVLVRRREDPSVGFGELVRVMLSKWRLLLAFPVMSAISSFTLDIVGSFYVFMFFESENTWASLWQSLKRGFVLNLRVLPLRLVAYLFAGVCILVPAILGSLIGWLLSLLYQISYWPGVILGVPFCVAVFLGFLWFLSRGIFFHLSFQSVLFDRVQERFPERI